MVLSFCIAVDQEILNWGWSGLCMFIHIAKVCTNKVINVNTSNIPICPVFHLCFPSFCYVSLLYYYFLKFNCFTFIREFDPQVLMKGFHIIIQYNHNFSAHKHLSLWLRVLSIKWLLCVTAVKHHKQQLIRIRVTDAVGTIEIPSWCMKYFRKGQKIYSFKTATMIKKK